MQYPLSPGFYISKHYRSFLELILPPSHKGSENFEGLPDKKPLFTNVTDQLIAKFDETHQLKYFMNMKVTQVGF